MLVMSLSKNSIANWFLVLLGVLFSRVLISLVYDIQPNPNVISSEMHTLELGVLNEDLIKAIFNLHSQPPLWNALLGLFSKACDADIDCVVRVGHGVLIFLTFLTCCLIHQALRILKFSNIVCLAGACVYSILPSVIFFEKFIF
jgi:hypothetical protein